MSKPHPIATNHADYAAAALKWERCRDAVAGTDAIKAKKEKYLPRLSAHEGIKGTKRYEAYLKRALYYNAAKRTKIGLSGAATIKPVKIDVVGKKAEEFAAQIAKKMNLQVEEDLEVGRYALVINQVDTEDPYMTFWFAESIVNWRYEEIAGQQTLTMIVLETTEELFEEGNPYEPKKTKVRHSYHLTEAGVCQYQKFIEAKDTEGGWKWTDPVILAALGGRTLDFIPAKIAGPLTEDESDVEDPLLLDLVDVNLSHYMNSADLEHGRHWTALPTAVASGFPTIDRDGNEIEMAVGGEAAWMTEIPGASAFYLEFSGAGLNHLQTGMTEKQAMMAVLGARLLEEAKPSVESAETIKTRLMGEKSVLSRVCQNVSRVSTWALRTMLWFAIATYDVSEAKDTIQLDTNFLDQAMTTGQLTALTAALQNNGISYQTYFMLLQNAEMIPENRTVEEEMELIDAGRPGNNADPFAKPGGGFGGI